MRGIPHCWWMGARNCSGSLGRGLGCISSTMAGKRLSPRVVGRGRWKQGRRRWPGRGSELAVSWAGNALGKAGPLAIAVADGFGHARHRPTAAVRGEAGRAVVSVRGGHGDHAGMPGAGLAAGNGGGDAIGGANRHGGGGEGKQAGGGQEEAEGANNRRHGERVGGWTRESLTLCLLLRFWPCGGGCT